MSSRSVTLLIFALVPGAALLFAGYIALQYHRVSLFLVVPAVLALALIAFLALDNSRANGAHWYKHASAENPAVYAIRLLANAIAITLIAAFAIFATLYILDILNHPENHLTDRRVMLNGLAVIVGTTLLLLLVLRRKRG